MRPGELKVTTGGGPREGSRDTDRFRFPGGVTGPSDTARGIQIAQRFTEADALDENGCLFVFICCGQSLEVSSACSQLKLKHLPWPTISPLSSGQVCSIFLRWDAASYTYQDSAEQDRVNCSFYYKVGFCFRMHALLLTNDTLSCTTLDRCLQTW